MFRTISRATTKEARATAKETKQNIKNKRPVPLKGQCVGIVHLSRTIEIYYVIINTNYELSNDVQVFNNGNGQSK